MDSGAVIDGCYRALMLVLWLSMPAVLTSAFVGLGMAIVQAVTQIQDQGVAQAIKLIAVFMVMALTSKWVATGSSHRRPVVTSVGMGGAMSARLMSAHTARAWFGSVSIALLAALTVPAVTNHVEAAEIHWRTNHFSYVAHDKPLKEFIRDFAASQGVSLVVAPEVSGTVNGKFDNTPQDILEMLSTSFGVTWYYDGSVLISLLAVTWPVR